MKLPEFLTTQIREGKVVLVLGAGASRGAVTSGGSKPPSGPELAKLLSDRFLGGAYSSVPLSQVSEYAISESSLTDVQEFIRTLFEQFEPSPSHLALTKFRWFGIATTNYDRLIEKGYHLQRDAVQKVQPVIENGDSIQNYLRNPDNVLLLKLHGCISRTASATCPLVLTPDQYVQYRAGRSRLFDTLQEWAYERPLVFIGHSIQDPDLRALLLEVAALGEHRQRSYAVTPDVTEIVARFWETKKITALNGTFEDFVDALDLAIPVRARTLSGLLVATEAHPIAERFRATDIVLSEGCRRFLNNDVDYVRSVQSESIEPRLFYKGLNKGWAAVEQNLDARRSLCDTILADVVLAEPSEHSKTSAELFLIKGYAGAGKTVFLRRLAWDAARDYGAVCLFVKPQGAILAVALKELLSALDERVYLFVDDAGDRTRELAALYREIGKDGARLTVFLAERINEWNVTGGPIDAYLSDQYVLPYLEPKEITELISLLARHKALGTLEHATDAERFAAFELKAGRQLLVALHEATLGRPFEDIIVDEYHSIVPAEAQEMYLTVCVLNRLNVPVRAGVISRIHGIPFDYFQERFFKPLEHVVQTAYDSLLRDHTYEARHPHIAEIVFQRVLTNAEDRLDKYLKCLAALNIDYTTDERAFRQMMRGRVIQELFPSSEMARHLFRVALENMGSEPFLLQQIALYEMNSPNGQLHVAGQRLDEAAARAPHDVSIKHSQSEYLIRLAEIARTPLEREQRLRDAIKIVNEIKTERTWRGEGSHVHHTLAKISLRRLEALLDSTVSDTSAEAIGNAIKAVEDNLLEGLQRFPGDAYLLSAEAELATVLKDSQRAVAAMQAAFKANPRNGAIAIRLAKSLESNGKTDEAKAVLAAGLDAGPGDKRLHFAFAKFLMRNDRLAADQVEYHLQRSFTEGDSNYDAQLLYARQLYMRGDIAGAKDRFRRLTDAKVSPDVRDEHRYPLEGTFGGRILRIEATYCFAARDGIGDWVFIHRSEVPKTLWPELKIGDQIRFGITFTMRGQTGFEVQRSA